MKRLLRLLPAAALFLSGMTAQAQISVHSPENVTFTKATLSATFPSSSTGNSFQIKTGSLTEVDDFSKMALDKDSDPVKIETTGTYAWKTRDVKGWVESYNKLSNNGVSDMTASVTFTTDTKVTFEWSVDSEENYGILEFYMDNVKQKEISGLVEFSKVEIDVKQGEHTFKWRYTKKSNTNAGLDLGMVRNIKFQDTTPGEWITKTASGGTLTLDNLMPNNSYLMRAVSDTEASKVVEFKTKDITIAPIKIDPITQTTATFNATADYGDCDVEAGYILTKGTDSNSIIPNLMKPGATIFPSLISNSGWTVAGTVNAIYYSGKETASLKISINVKEKATLKFYARIDNTSYRYFTFYVDNVAKVTINSTGKYYEIEVTEGIHTLEWKSYTGIYSYSYYAYLSNLEIPGLIEDDSVTFQEGGLLKPSNVDPIKVSPSDLSHVIKELTPNTTYTVYAYLESKSNAINNKKWAVKTSAFGFTTKNVSSSADAAADIMQASAVLKAKFNGGDATVETKGIEYREDVGTRWTDIPVEGADEISQKLTRLKPATKYRYRTYIQAAGQDKVYSQEQNFTTLAVKANTPEVKKLSQHQVTLEGTVEFGDATIYQRGMQFRKSGDSVWTDVEDGGEEATYTLVKRDLEMGSKYEARTFIQPAGCDIIYSNILSFSTRESYLKNYHESIVTQSTIEILQEILDIDDDVTIEEIGYDYYEIDGHDIVVKNVITKPEGESGKSCKVKLENLSPKTQYSFTSYVKINGEKITQHSFSVWTKPVYVEVYNLKVTQTTASLDVAFTKDCDVTASKLMYSVDNDSYSDYSGTIKIKDLTPNSWHYVSFKCIVGGKESICGVTNGEDNSYQIHTSAISATLRSSSVAQTSAMLTPTFNIGDAIFEKAYIKIGDKEYPTENGKAITVNELAPNTKYSATLYVSVKGSSVNSSVNFTTKSISVKTDKVTNISNRSATLNGTIDCDANSSAQFGFQWL